MTEPRPGQPRKTYASPELQVYGNIAVITAASNMGTMADGGITFPNTMTA